MSWDVRALTRRLTWSRLVWQVVAVELVQEAGIVVGKEAVAKVRSVSAESRSARDM